MFGAVHFISKMEAGNAECGGNSNQCPLHPIICQKSDAEKWQCCDNKRHNHTVYGTDERGSRPEPVQLGRSASMVSGGNGLTVEVHIGSIRSNRFHRLIIPAIQDNM